MFRFYGSLAVVLGWNEIIFYKEREIDNMKKLSITTSFILIMFAIVFISMTVYMYFQSQKIWQEQYQEIEKDYQLIINTKRTILEEQIWQLVKFSEVELNINSLLNYPYVNYVKIAIKNDTVYARGNSEKDAIKKGFDIHHKHYNLNIKIAHLDIEFSKNGMRKIHDQNLKKIILREILQIFIFLLVIYLVTKFLVINRLKTIEKYLLSDHKRKDTLNLKKIFPWFYDEIDIVARSINTMQNNIYSMFDELSNKNLETVKLMEEAVTAKQKAENAAEELQHEILEREKAELELKTANSTLNKSRVSALNLMEDAIDAQKAAEQATETLQKQTAELQAKNEELSKFNQVVVGREMRMIELKKEINALCEKLGEPKRHSLDFMDQE